LWAQGNNTSAYDSHDLARFLIRTGNINTAGGKKYKATVTYNVSSLNQTTDTPSSVWVSLDIRRASDNQSVYLYWAPLPQGKTVRYFDISKTGLDARTVVTNTELPAGQYYAVGGYDIRALENPNSSCSLTGKILQVRLEPYQEYIVQ